MRTIALMLVCWLIAGCGMVSQGDDNDEPADTAFTPYVGTWDGEVLATSGVYTTQFTVGQHKSATITRTGVVTTTDAGGATITYQLVAPAIAGNAFTANRIVSGNVESLSVDFTTPAAGTAVFSLLGGNATWRLVKISSTI